MMVKSLMLWLSLLLLLALPVQATNYTTILRPGDSLQVIVPATPGPDPTPPPVSADFVISPSVWTFGAQGSAGGNYRLEVVPNKAVITVAFTTAQAGKGGSVNLQWSSGTTCSHTMTVDGHVATSQSPAMAFSTVTPGPSKYILQAFTTYIVKIETAPACAASGVYHLNFQNSPY